MTPAEIIDDVLLDIARPDLQEKAETKFLQAVRSAHKIAKFRQDFSWHFLLDETPLDGRIIFSLPTTIPRFRELKTVNLYEKYTIGGDGNIYASNQINLLRGFTDIADGMQARDYYGFSYPHTYSITGNTCTLRGVPDRVDCIELGAVTYPSVTRNELTAELQTNSWIVLEHPDLVKAYLYWEIAKMIQDNNRIQTAVGTIQTLRHDFLTEHAQDIL